MIGDERWDSEVDVRWMNASCLRLLTVRGRLRLRKGNLPPCLLPPKRRVAEIFEFTGRCGVLPSLPTLCSSTVFCSHALPREYNHDESNENDHKETNGNNDGDDIDGRERETVSTTTTTATMSTGREG